MDGGIKKEDFDFKYSNGGYDKVEKCNKKYKYSKYEKKPPKYNNTKKLIKM